MIKIFFKDDQTRECIINEEIGCAESCSLLPGHKLQQLVLTKIKLFYKDIDKIFIKNSTSPTSQRAPMQIIINIGNHELKAHNVWFSGKDKFSISENNDDYFVIDESCCECESISCPFIK